MEGNLYKFYLHQSQALFRKYLRSRYNIAPPDLHPDYHSLISAWEEHNMGQKSSLVVVLGLNLSHKLRIEG